MARYGGTKLERTRDLFEQCLDGCPSQFAKNIYLLYAKLEEEHGMARHAMAVYDRAVGAVDKKEQFEIFNIYLRKAAEIYGVTRTRQIYEKAIEVLTEGESREMCVRFAEMETKLGEIDRARAIYGHCSQMCDPRVTPDFWQNWKDFEVSLRLGIYTKKDLFPIDRIRHIFKISFPAGKTWQRGHTERNAEDQEKRAGNLQYPGMSEQAMC